MSVRMIELMAGWAWEASLAASILIVVAVALGRWLPVNLRVWLGLLAMARLLMPVSPASAWSVFNLAPERELAVKDVAGVLELTAVASNAQPAGWKPAIQQARSLRYDWPALIWFLGAAAFFSRAGVQQVRIWRRARQGDCLGSEEILSLLEEAKQTLGIRREVRVCAVKGVKVPALFGFWRPRILLPEELAKTASVRTLRLIFLHELAHVRRGHVAINWLMILAQGLHWFNPLVWVAFRRLRADQEILCDADVVGVLGVEERRGYGEALLSLASDGRSAGAMVLPISSNFKQMKERMQMITQFKPATKRLVFLGVILIATLSVATFTRAVDKKEPKPKPESQQRNREAEQRAVYLERLKKLWAQQSDVVEAKAKETDKLRKELAIVGDPPNSESVSSLHVEKIRFLWSEISRLDAKIAEREELMRALSRPTAIATLTTNPDPGLTRLLQEQETIEREIVRLAQDHSPDHPEFKASEKVLNKIREQIQTRIDSMQKGVEMAIQSDLKMRDRLRINLEEVEHLHRDSVERSRPYFRAKRDLEILEKNRDDIYIRILQEQVDSQIPK